MVVQLPLLRPERATSPAHELLDELAHRGVALTVDRGMVRWRAAPGNMNVRLMREVKAHEPELIALLQAAGDAPSAHHDLPRGA